MRRVCPLVMAAMLLAACDTAATSDTSPAPVPRTTVAVDATATIAPLPALTSTTAPPTTTALASTTTTARTTTTTEAADVEPPPLTVTDPVAEAVVSAQAYRFRGATEPGATVTAAGRYPVDVAGDGSWSIVLMLNPGGNVATFVAEDAAGNRTEVRRAVFLHECVDEPVVAIPPGAADRTSTTGDLDGDGVADTATVYRNGGAWFLAVELAYGWSTALDITTQTEAWSNPAEAHRIVDVGDPVALVIHGGTLIGDAAGVYGFHGCGIESLRDLERGDLLELYFGVSNGSAHRYVCGSGGFTQAALFRTDSGDGFVLETSDARYQRDRRGFEVTVHAPEVLGRGLTPGELDELWGETLARFPQC